MSTGFVDPNGTASTSGWIRQPASGTIDTKIDDGTRQPTAPSTVSDFIYGDGGSNCTGTLNLSTISVSAVSRIKLWAYIDMDHSVGVFGVGGTLYIDLLIGGVSQGEAQLLQCPGGDSKPFQWQSATYDGTWTQADLDGAQMKLRLVLDSTDDAGDILDRVFTAYGEVTYTDPIVAPSVGLRERPLTRRTANRLRRI